MSFRAWVATLPPAEGEVRVVPGPVAEIVLDHPPTRNALHPGMMVQLADAVAAVAQARVVLLRGAGGSFCSGGNLAAVRAHLVRPGAGRELQAFMAETVDALSRLPAVVLGVLDGAALGGGAELLTACDEVWAAPNAKVGFVQAKLGVSPGFGGGARLIHRVGPARALRLLTATAPIPAEAARALGVVDEVVDDPLGAARARAEALVGLPEASLRGVLRLVRAARETPTAVAAVEAEVFAALWGGPDHVAALDAARRGR